MRRITYTNWMSKIFKEITNGRGERVLENPAVQVLGAIFRKMNLDQNTIGAVSERLQNEKEKKDKHRDDTVRSIHAGRSSPDRKRTG